MRDYQNTHTHSHTLSLTHTQTHTRKQQYQQKHHQFVNSFIQQLPWKKARSNDQVHAYYQERRIINQPEGTVFSLYACAIALALDSWITEALHSKRRSKSRDSNTSALTAWRETTGDPNLFWGLSTRSVRLSFKRWGQKACRQSKQSPMTSGSIVTVLNAFRRCCKPLIPIFLSERVMPFHPRNSENPRPTRSSTQRNVASLTSFTAGRAAISAIWPSCISVITACSRETLEW